MKTITFEGEAGHPYHVYCALGGNVYTSAPPQAASGWLESDDAGEEFIINGVSLTEWPEDRTDAEAWTALFAEKECGVTCTGVDGPSEPESDTVKVHLQALEPGAAGNAITLEADGAGARVSGATLEGGADYSRTLVGVMDRYEYVRVVPSSGHTTLEADIPDGGAVKFRDPLEQLALRGPIRTVPGQFYTFTADDVAEVISHNTVVVQFPAFGGSGAFQATSGEVLVRTKPSASIHVNPCVPCDPPAVYKLALLRCVAKETGEPD